MRSSADPHAAEAQLPRSTPGSTASAEATVQAGCLACGWMGCPFSHRLFWTRGSQAPRKQFCLNEVLFALLLEARRLCGHSQYVVIGSLSVLGVVARSTCRAPWARAARTTRSTASTSTQGLSTVALRMKAANFVDSQEQAGAAALLEQVKSGLWRGRPWLRRLRRCAQAAPPPAPEELLEHRQASEGDWSRSHPPAQPRGYVLHNTNRIPTGRADTVRDIDRCASFSRFPDCCPTCRGACDRRPVPTQAGTGACGRRRFPPPPPATAPSAAL